MASMNCRDYYLHYYREDIESFSPTTTESEIALMEKWLNDPRKSSSNMTQEALVINHLMMTGVLSNSFFSDSKNAEMRANFLVRLNSIQEQFSKLIKENKKRVSPEEFDELSAGFRESLRCKGVIFNKLADCFHLPTPDRIEAAQTQLTQIVGEINHLLNLYSSHSIGLIQNTAAQRDAAVTNRNIATQLARLRITERTLKYQITKYESYREDMKIKLKKCLDKAALNTCVLAEKLVFLEIARA